MWAISVKSVSKRFTLSRSSSRRAIRMLRLRPLVVRPVHHLEDRHIRDRRTFAEEMLARLSLGSGRRIARKISSGRRLNLDVICFSDEEVFKVDAAAPGHPFSHIFLEKTWATQQLNLSFSHGDAKTRISIVTSAHF